ncbi:MAG TPA: DMT family transporter [Candidatus Limnocylindrales bacterium]|nr:DMT family transporter [Candidatus Limnocylindrales bacterium]
MPSSWRPFALLVLAAACWGTGTVLSKQAVAEVPPLVLLSAQLVVSVAVLGLAMARDRATIRGLDPRLIGLGALNPGLAYALSLIGLTSISASLSVLLWAIEPILILLLASAVLRERPGGQVAGLSVLALGGLAVVLNAPAAHVEIVGVAATVAGIACCAAYSVGSRRWIVDAPSTLPVVFGQQVVAAGFAVSALVVGLVAGAAVLPSAVSGPGIASVVASGVLYYGAAYLLYLSALRDLPVSVAAISFYLVPIVGVAAAAAAGETLSAIQWAGAAITIGAVLAVGGIEIRRSVAA